jgi:hypothetical protein
MSWLTAKTRAQPRNAGLAYVDSKHRGKYSGGSSALGKDAPCTRPIERFVDIVAYPILGGLHHRYAVI